MCISQVFKGFVFNNRLYSKLFQITSGRQLFTSVTSLQGSMAKERQTNDDPKTKCKAIVITGPSGSGKSTLLNMLMNDYKDSFKFCVSHTTRKPRPNEEHSKAYHFIDHQTFEEMIKNDEFVEYAVFSKNFYGTSVKELTTVRSSGRIPVLDLDIRGVISLKGFHFDAKYILITAPTFERLEQNLRKRGSENEETIRDRLVHAIEDIKTAQQVHFDLVVVNDDLASAYEKLSRFLSELSV